jgi:hypothetical protein
LSIVVDAIDALLSVTVTACSAVREYKFRETQLQIPEETSGRVPSLEMVAYFSMYGTVEPGLSTDTPR